MTDQHFILVVLLPLTLFNLGCVGMSWWGVQVINGYMKEISTREGWK